MRTLLVCIIELCCKTDGNEAAGCGRTYHFALVVISSGAHSSTMVCDELTVPALYQSIESYRRAQNGLPGGTSVGWTLSFQPARYAPPLSSGQLVVARVAAGRTEKLGIW